MKVILSEEQQNKLKLAPFIYKAIVSKNTSLGDNPVFPNYGTDFGLEYDLIKTKFEEVDEIINNTIKHGELESKDPDYLVSVLNKKIEECRKIEKTLAPQLEKLCENIVNDLFSIPEDTVILKCKLVGKVKPKHSIRILPEGDGENNTYDFEDVGEAELTNKVILKRRVVNSLVQGFAYWLSTDMDDWYDTVHELNENLWNLWYQIIHISDYLLFVKKEEISEKNPNQLGYVEVHLGKKGKKTSVDAQGVIFPFLLREALRGLFELFSSHGLPEDSKKAMYIIRKSDFLVAEPWDLRFGMAIIDVLHNTLTKKYQVDLLFKTNRIPFFFTELCSLPVEEFNDFMQNIFMGTKKGEVVAKQMDSEIVHDFEYQAFKDRIQQKNINTSLISDGDFSKEELGDYVIQENETDEMMAYHGSGSNFDKFNHKKYLNTGAGSQSFGWGTYVTNDDTVAMGYSESSKRIPNEKYVDLIAAYLVNNKNMPDDVETKIKAEEYSNMLFSDYRAVGGFDELKDVYEDYLKHPNRYNINQEKIDLYTMFVDVLSKNKKEHAFLYEVEIPDDNGENYIEWYEHFPSEFMKRLLHGFLTIHQKYLDSIAEKDYGFNCDLHRDIQWIKQNPNRADEMINILSNSDDYDDFFSSGFYTQKPTTEGKFVYGRLRSLFGSPKAASLFLMHCGFDGIKYPSGTMWKKPDGASEDAYNYVIFDANKVKIVNKTKV